MAEWPLEFAVAEHFSSQIPFDFRVDIPKRPSIMGAKQKISTMQNIFKRESQDEKTFIERIV